MASMRPEHIVAIVLDEDFTLRLAEVAEVANVWLVDTQANRAASERWRAAGTGSKSRVTTFRCATPSLSEGEAEYLLDAILEHHPACTRIELYATGIPEALFDAIVGTGLACTSRAGSPVVFGRGSS
jgi:hypothetical protein